jgi:hypothetical protein
MAEIKSTMDMVLERAARMGSGASVDLAAEEKVKEGMRLGAGYLRGEAGSLTERISAVSDEAERKALRKGALQALLRNIFLAREGGQLQNSDKAMEGLVELGQGEGEVLRACGEMKKILEGYLQHREHLKRQLEEQFSQQMAMLEKNLAKQTGMSMKLQPAQHPKFQEEWNRLKVELNNQYGRALEQHKQMLASLLAG